MGQGTPGDRRRGGALHYEMAQGRGGEELAIRHAAENAKSSDKGKPGGGDRSDTAVRIMQERIGRSCGKEPVRLISGACATIALNPTLSGSFRFVCFR